MPDELMANFSDQESVSSFSTLNDERSVASLDDESVSESLTSSIRSEMSAQGDELDFDPSFGNQATRR